MYVPTSMPNTINVSVVFSVFSPAFKTLSCNLTVFSKKKPEHEHCAVIIIIYQWSMFYSMCMQYKVAATTSKHNF